MARTSPSPTADTTNVTVAMQPFPLPLGTIRLRVFNDQAPVDATYEAGSQEDSDCSANPAPGRTCMAGFTAHISDVLGEVTTDYYGNPLCTTYETDSHGIVFQDGSPVIAAGSAGRCLSDANGDIVIPNLGPDRYAAQVVPPSTGAHWFQTTTLEGGHDWDIWTQEGDTGYDTEQTVGQELQPAVQFGYVQAEVHLRWRRRGQGHRRRHQHLCRWHRRRRRPQRRRGRGQCPRPGTRPARGALRPRQQRPDGLHGPRERRTAASTSPASRPAPTS